MAAVAGLCAATTGHYLDATGRLPFVHEAVAVRTAMSPAQVVIWLALAAVLSAVAATTRVLLVGAPGALLVSAAPELIGRGDPGALVEPGALLGALAQLVLLLAVVAVALVLERRLFMLRRPRLSTSYECGRPARSPSAVPSVVDRTAAPRGPPVGRQFADLIIRPRGLPCPHDLVAASWRPR